MCVLWGARVVVPPPGREQVVQELCEMHPGIARIKSLARSYVVVAKDGCRPGGQGVSLC